MMKIVIKHKGYEFECFHREGLKTVPVLTILLQNPDYRLTSYQDVDQADFANMDLIERSCDSMIRRQDRAIQLLKEGRPLPVCWDTISCKGELDPVTKILGITIEVEKNPDASDA